MYIRLAFAMADLYYQPMSELLLNLNTAVSLLCLLMALHLFWQRSFYRIPVKLLAACFLTMGLQALFLGLNLSNNLTVIASSIQPTMALLFGPLSYFMFKSAQKSAQSDSFRFAPSHIVSLVPAVLVLVLMLYEQGSIYVDYIILSSLLIYATLLSKFALKNKSYVQTTCDSRIKKNGLLLPQIYAWLLMFIGYSWFSFISDLLIFVEISTGKAGVQSIALSITLLFKLFFISFTVFLALQKSPFFDWLYVAFDLNIQEEFKPDEEEIINKIIISFEHLIKEPSVYTNEVLSLKNMASKLNVSARAFSNAVNHHYGESYTKHMNRLRIKVAEKLLVEQQELSIISVMYESGFRTKSSFNKEFKALNGISPSDYRRSCLNIELA
jgi:AraC-like DNA-binding protein